MARIRTIKPEFPHSESIGRLTRDARLLFIQLWTLVDDEGRARAASRMLASLLYPYDDDAAEQMPVWLAELERNGLIRVYEVECSRYLEILNWLKHQKIDHPSKSRLPAFSEALANPREPSRTLAPDLGPVPRTKDQDQEKRRSLRSRGAFLSDDWKPTEEDNAYGLSKGLSAEQISEAAEEMRLWAKANSNRSIGRKADWSSTFKSWMRRNGGKTHVGKTAANGLSAALQGLKQHIGEIDRSEEGREPPPRLLSHG